MGEHTTTQLDAWLLRIRDGDDRAFNELLRHFEGRLEALASRMLKGFPRVAAQEQTGDVLQEALLRLRVAIKAMVAADENPAGTKSFHGADFFKFVALQIRRELLDMAQRHRRIDEPADRDAFGHPAGSTWDPAKLAEWTEFHEKAAMLPEKTREVFELLFYDGLKQEDAADLLGVDVRTVRSRWQDARLRLGHIFRSGLPGL